MKTVNSVICSVIENETKSLTCYCSFITEQNEITSKTQHSKEKDTTYTNRMDKQSLSKRYRAQCLITSVSE